MVQSFQNFKHHQIFILSLKAGGTGLNLTAAANVIHYDLWWNPAVESQATDRAYRIGQKNNVMVYRLINKNTLEERIDEMIQSKKHLADLAVATGENWLGDLSNQELKDLVKLSQND
jgi:SNF2 family DNA or RNA helicase